MTQIAADGDWQAQLRPLSHSVTTRGHATGRTRCWGDSAVGQDIGRPRRQPQRGQTTVRARVASVRPSGEQFPFPYPATGMKGVRGDKSLFHSGLRH